MKPKEPIKLGVVPQPACQTRVAGQRAYTCLQKEGKRFLSFLLLFIALGAQGQTPCDLTRLSPQKKNALAAFAQQFQSAIVSQDKAKLAGLIRFPFPCSQCVPDSSEENSRTYYTISYPEFERAQYRIFFTPYLLEALGDQDLLQLIQVDERGKGGPCSYSVSYPIVKPSTKWEGQQGFFSIRYVGGKYKIVSAWMVP